MLKNYRMAVSIDFGSNRLLIIVVIGMLVYKSKVFIQ